MKTKKKVKEMKVIYKDITPTLTEAEKKERQEALEQIFDKVFYKVLSQLVEESKKKGA